MQWLFLDLNAFFASCEQREQLLAQIVRFEQMTERHTVVSSGTGSRPTSMSTKRRIADESYSASSTAGSDRLNRRSCGLGRV